MQLASVKLQKLALSLLSVEGIRKLRAGIEGGVPRRSTVVPARWAIILCGLATEGGSGAKPDVLSGDCEV
jgi:hypothetical protein